MVNLPCLVIIFVILASPGRPARNYERKISKNAISINDQIHLQIDSLVKTIHVFVALCDNKYQGIVPVPASIGNGQDPKTNLYWGAAHGVKTFFSKSKEWKLVSSQAKPAANILERLLFKHKTKDVYLLADAYDGQFIKQTTIDFLNASSGKNKIELKDREKKIYFGGASNLLAYIGHDGLMDFSLQQQFTNASTKKRETIILACYSKNYFSPHLKSTGASPLVWTSGLMAPEAYTLHDAIHEWVNDASDSRIRDAAAAAYSKYQKCSLKAAKNLLIQGW
jgi:hypothetical protein